MQHITKIAGRAIPMRGNDIDTDRIVPARFLRAITFDGMEAHLFEDDRKMGGPGHNRHPFDVPAYQGASILLVNANFGCGSSREHAPQAIRRWGIEAIIGESFAEIFFGNSAMIGMPCVTASTADIRTLQDLVERNPRIDLRIDLIEGTCAAGDLRCAVSLPQRARRVCHRRVGHDRSAPRTLRRGQRDIRAAALHRGRLITGHARRVHKTAPLHGHCDAFLVFEL